MATSSFSEPDNLSEALLAGAVSYFRQQGFTRFLDLMLRKYQSLGRWAGSVKLANLTPEEQEALSAFFRRDLRHKNSTTIRLEDFEESLAQTKFAGIPAVAILEGLTGDVVLTRSQVLEERERNRIDYFAKLRALFSHSFCQQWLTAIEQSSEGTRSVQIAYEKDSTHLFQQMSWVLAALAELENIRGKGKSIDNFERLPVFALRITKNPHGFDLDSEAGKLLINALSVLRDLDGDSAVTADMKALDKKNANKNGRTAVLSGSEALNELFYHYGLLRDDLWNFVTCSGLVAMDKEAKELSVWVAASQHNSVLNVPLREVVKVQEIYPASRKHGNIVYVVENPAVFSVLLDEAEKNDRAYPALLCTHGQFKLSALLLMDKLVASGAVIYYSGDFDPEGLLMAESLLNRYPGSVAPWHYSKEAYLFSRPEKELSAMRLKKLEGVQSPELFAVKTEILKLGRAGYQEGIIPLLWRDMKLKRGLLEL